MRKSKLVSGRRGSVTIFSCLIMVAVIMLNLVLVDGAKILSHKAAMKRRSENAAYSVLAGYNSLLTKYYGLYALNDNMKDFSNQFKTYANPVKYDKASYQNFNESGILSIDLMPYKLYSADVVGINPLSDLSVLQNQIKDHMKYRTPVNLSTQLLERLGILKSSGDMGQAFNISSNASSLIESAQSGRKKLKNIVEGMFPSDSACVNGFDKSGLRNNGLILLHDSVSNIEAIDNINIITNAYLLYNTNAINEIVNLKDINIRIVNEIEKLEKWLLTFSAKNDMETSFKNNIENDCKQLRNMSKSISNISLESKLNENISQLNKSYEAGLELEDYITNTVPEDMAVSIISQLISKMKIEGYINNISISVNEKPVSPEDANKDPRDGAASDAKNVFFRDNNKNINIPDDIFKSLPSQKKVNEDEAWANFDGLSFNDFGVISDLINSFSNNANFALNAWDSIVTDDYILTYFGNNLKDSNMLQTFFKSEAEYIIVGDKSQDENINGVRNRLLAIRFTLNLIHVYCDPEKKAIADSIGIALATTISAGIGGPVYSALVMSAWAMSESVIDVKDLMSGKLVCFYKNKADWNLGIQGLVTNDTNKTQDRLKLSYEDYLRVLLLFTDKESKLLRISDLIELNFTNNADSNFSLSTSYTAIQVKYSYSLPISPSTISFIPKERKTGNSFIIEGEGKFGY